MYNIGQKIKELRKKNDLTQEKLADFLGVTYQCVSKWECGVTSPDLSLIAPLTKLLHCTSDELLGLTETAVDARRAELEENLRQAWLNGGELDGFALVYEAEEALVREYPGDMKLLCDFAWTVSNRAWHHDDFRTETEKAIRHFDTVIENTNDEKVKAFAIEGITHALGYLDRLDEAKKYAELLPDAPYRTKNQILENCLRGEELREHQQNILEISLHSLIVGMIQCRTDKLQAIADAEEILRIFFPDENYLEFHCNLIELAQKKACICLHEKRYEEAVHALAEYKKHSLLADKADVHAEELRYTSPYFDLLTLPPNLPEESYTPYEKAFLLRMQDDLFDPLRDRDDFRALIE